MDDFHWDVKSYMTFILIATVTSNKLVRLIAYLPLGDSFTRPCLLWPVTYGKTPLTEEYEILKIICTSTNVFVQIYIIFIYIAHDE